MTMGYESWAGARDREETGRATERCGACGQRATSVDGEGFCAECAELVAEDHRELDFDAAGRDHYGAAVWEKMSRELAASYVCVACGERLGMRDTEAAQLFDCCADCLGELQAAADRDRQAVEGCDGCTHHPSRCICALVDDLGRLS